MAGGVQDDVQRGVGTRLLRVEQQERVLLGRRVAPLRLDPVMEDLLLPLREDQLLLLVGGPSGRLGIGRDRQGREQRDQRLSHVGLHERVS